jgi:hypothetical protein
MDHQGNLSRRDALALLGATGVVARLTGAGRGPDQGAASPPGGMVGRNDQAVRTLLDTQIADAGSPWRGSVPDQYGLHSAGSAAGVAET